MNDKFEYYLLVIRCYWPFILFAVSVILFFMPNDTLHSLGMVGFITFWGYIGFLVFSDWLFGSPDK